MCIEFLDINGGGLGGADDLLIPPQGNVNSILTDLYVEYYFFWIIFMSIDSTNSSLIIQF